ncbi:MAG TPA: hypothetical protein DCP10_03520 [Bacteroidales bacterium]|nr:hypothetical protein [Bacteroidales bacterium]
MKTSVIFNRCSLILISLLLIAFTTGDNKSQYSVPIAAWSVTAGDIDMDDDNDIVIGHNYNSQTQWSGVSIMLNNGNGYFSLYDSVFLFAGQSDVLMKNLNTIPHQEIIGNFIDSQTGMKFLAIINDFDLTNISYFAANTEESINDKTIGDINGDGNVDIVVASHDGKFWGVLYNDGSGIFSEPEYNYVSNFFPTAIACGDLNNDNRDDIVVCGQSTEVYFSYPDGFQSLVLEANNFKQGASIVDFDLDGDNDILTFVGIPIVGVTSLIMYKNQGNNVFDTLPEFYFQPMSSRFFVTDFNNDSLQDILFQLSDKSGYIIYYNQGDFQLANSQFVALPPSNPQEGWRNCHCADMDGNGYNDIITVKTLYAYLPDNLEILFNDGNGNFVEDPITQIQELIPVDNKPILTCYPNPFRTEITFQFTIQETAPVELSVYNLQGKLIRGLTLNNLKGGITKIKWDGLDTGGKPCKPGPYIAYLKANGKIRQSLKLMKLN